MISLLSPTSSLSLSSAWYANAAAEESNLCFRNTSKNSNKCTFLINQTGQITICRMNNHYLLCIGSDIEYLFTCSVREQQKKFYLLRCSSSSNICSLNKISHLIKIKSHCVWWIKLTLMYSTGAQNWNAITINNNVIYQKLKIIRYFIKIWTH